MTCTEAYREALTRDHLARVRPDRPDLEELLGTGTASADFAKIEEAAAQGRVETLLLSAEPSCWEREATGPPTVHQLGDEGDGDAAAVFRY